MAGGEYVCLRFVSEKPSSVNTVRQILTAVFCIPLYYCYGISAATYRLSEDYTCQSNETHTHA